MKIYCFKKRENRKGREMRGRISQNKAMEYVGIARLGDFVKWVERYKVPYSLQGNKKLFRVSALDEAILKQEECCAAILNSAREAAQ